MAVGRMQSAAFVVHYKGGGLHPPYEELTVNSKGADPILE